MKNPLPAPAFPNVNGLSVTAAAFVYAEKGVPIVPFNPKQGKGKSCGNLVGGRQKWYSQVTTDWNQLCTWREKYGEFQAIATSPGAIGCLVIDVDKPNKFPRAYRTYLDNSDVPFVNTRPTEHKRRGHYWYKLPAGVEIGNRAFKWGELRSVGGGIVLPPYGDRSVIVSGVINPIAPELLTFLKAGSGCGLAGTANLVTLQQSYEAHTDCTRPHKLVALRKLHAHVSGSRSAHDAMRECLRVGLGEAAIGYVPAKQVIGILMPLWPKERDSREFYSLAEWAANIAVQADTEELKLKSDRAKGTDSRQYAGISKRKPDELN